MKELPGALAQPEIEALRELEPLYDRLAHARGKDALSKARKNLDGAKHKYAALSVDSRLTQAVFELLEATWLLRQVYWNRESITNLTFDRVVEGIEKAREGLKDYQFLSSLDDKNRIKRLHTYCSNEDVLAALSSYL